MTGKPQNFAKVREREDGRITVRFDRYPEAKTRVEIEHFPFPRDLQNNTVSVPLVPYNYAKVLEYAGTYFLMRLKEDDQQQTYAELTKVTLQSMVKKNEGELHRAGIRFGQVVARSEQLNRRIRPELRFGSPEG